MEPETIERIESLMDEMGCVLDGDPELMGEAWIIRYISPMNKPRSAYLNTADIDRIDDVLPVQIVI